MNDATDHNAPVLPAAQIIDLFGGVRPLAKKLEMAASTVQGWKLRNHIPEQYHERLRNLLPMDAQNQFNMLLSGAVLSSAAATPSELPVAEISITPTADKIPTSPPHMPKSAQRPPQRDPNAHYFAMPQAQLRYWVMTSLAMVGIIALVTVVLVFVFFGKDIFDLIKTETVGTSMIQDVQPTPLPAIQTESNNNTETIDKLRRSRDVIDSTLSDVRKIKADTPSNQKELVSHIGEIETMIGSLRDRIDTLDTQLQAKGVDAQAIQEQMSQISRRDVAAAALLLGVAQIHTLLDRQTKFGDDLKFLKTLLSYDPEMVKSIDKLAPFAEKGLMTKEQMNETLTMLQKQTLDVTAAHPEASWMDRLQMAVSNVIQIRKGDTPITMPNTMAANNNSDIKLPETPQEQVALAQKLIQDDSFAAAAHILQDYKGPHADIVMELAHNLQGRDAAVKMLDTLMEKSQNLLQSDQLKSLLTPPSENSSPDNLY